MTYLNITVSTGDIFVVRATEYMLFLYLTKTFFADRVGTMRNVPIAFIIFWTVIRV